LNSSTTLVGAEVSLPFAAGVTLTSAA